MNHKENFEEKNFVVPHLKTQENHKKLYRFFLLF